MIRYSTIVLAIVGTAATAIASLPSHPLSGVNAENMTTIYKNQTWDSAEVPLFLEKCAKEDCSDTPSN